LGWKFKAEYFERRRLNIYQILEKSSNVLLLDDELRRIAETTPNEVGHPLNSFFATISIELLFHKE